MTKVLVNIHSSEGITTEIKGVSQGRLLVERRPRVGTPGGMDFGGGEILCFAAGTCLYNYLRRIANDRGIILTKIAIEVTAEWDDPSPVAREIRILPRIEAEASPSEIQELINRALEESSVANTLQRGVPVRIFLPEGDE